MEHKIAEKTLNDLFLETLKDIYHAEKQIYRKLPKMAKNANSQELKNAFLTHREETTGQIERLEQIFESLGKRAQGKPCEAMKGILEEGEEVIEDFGDSDALDAVLLAAAQTVEDYEISRYGAMKAWAKQLGTKDAEKLLDETLKEEIKTDLILSMLAEMAMNPKAAGK